MPKLTVLMGAPGAGKLYRMVMRIAHRFHWHYAPPIYPEGDTQLWCKWCGFRQTVKSCGAKSQIA